MEFPCGGGITAVIVFLSTASLYMYFFILRRKKSNRGFRSYPLLGVLPDFLLNRHRFLDWVTDVLAGIPSHTATFNRPVKVYGVLTANPRVVEYILKTNVANYEKGPRFRSLLHDFLGDGIFNADGESWSVQRKAASHEFNTKSLRNFVMECAAAESESRLIPLLEEASRSGKVLDFQDLLERFALDNICKLSFDFDPHCLGGDASQFMRSFDEAALISSGRFLCVFQFLIGIKKLFNVGSEKALRKSIAAVHGFVDEIIKSRSQRQQLDAEHRRDLLSRFIRIPEASSPKRLRDIVISFILAGRDTTSSALSWFFYLLSVNPHVERNILRELASIRLESGEKPHTLEDLREMHYLHAAITEAMRLYPPVAVDSVACIEDDTLPDGTSVGKGCFVSYLAYSMGRMESIWGDDSGEYKPERWIEKGVFKAESPYKYPVFHGGPRMCLGKEMAYIQMKFIAASVLKKFSFDVLVEEGKVPQHVLSLTMRMKEGLPIRVKERKFWDIYIFNPLILI